MKRKKQLIGLLALTGALALTVSSCKKYDDDIDQLRQEIAANKAALEAALKAGKLITAVNPVTGGWDIVFSDNSKITVTNGKDGDAGKDAFAPVIGIDAEGYWTVITIKDGEPVRIKDASGKDVKAVASVPVANQETKTWWIDGVDTEISYVGEKGDPGTPGKDGKSPYVDKDTNHWMVYNDQSGEYEDSGVEAKILPGKVEIIGGTLYIDGNPTNATNIPAVAYNDLNKTVMITVGQTSYEFLQASDVMVMITSVSAPIAKPLIGISYGTVGTDFNWAKETYKANDLLLTGGAVIVPVIVNPAGASLEGCKVEIVDPEDASFVIPVSKVTKGYDYKNLGFASAATAGAPTNGLWSLELALTADNLALLNALPGKKAEHLAVKVTKGEGEDARVIYSGYQYTAQSAAVATLENLDAAVTPLTLALGEKADLLEGVAVEQLYRDSLAYTSTTATGGVDAVKKLVAISGSEVSTVDDKATSDLLEGKAVVYKIEARNYVGAQLTKDITVNYYTSIGLEDVTLAQTPLTLKASADTVFADMAPVFAALGDKKALWETNATTFKYEVKNAKGVQIVASTALAASGDMAVFFTEKNISDDSQNPLVFANDKSKYVAVKADATKIVPGDYTVTITFADNRSAAYKTFKIIVPVKVSNPSDDVADLFARTPALFDGDKIAVFGADQATAPSSYDLNDAYGTIPADGYYGFVFKQKDGESLTDPITSGKTFAINTVNMYKEHVIEVYYYYFANKNNKKLVETIYVTPKSVVREGALLKKGTAAFELTHGTGGATPQTLQIGSFWSFNDYNKNDLKIFESGRDAKAATVEVEAVGANKALVSISANGSNDKDFDIATTAKVADLATDSAQVDIKVSITDLFGQKYVKTVQLTVNKPKN